MPEYPQSLWSTFDPVGSFARGYGLVSNIKQSQQQQALKEMQIQDEIRRREALSQYGQTGDVSQLMQADPSTGIKVMDYLRRSRNDEADRAVSTLNTGIKVFEHMGAQFINEPQLYAPFYQHMLSIGFPANALMEPQRFMGLSATQRRDYINARAQEAQAIKGSLSEYQKERLAQQEKDVSSKVSNREAQLGIAKQRLGLYGAEIGAKIGEISRKGGEKPSFADFINDPEIAKLPYREQVFEFNKMVEGGKESAKTYRPAKQLTPEQQRKQELMDSFMQKMGLSKPKGPAGTAIFNERPDPATNKGKYLTSPTGEVFKSDGANWVPYAGTTMTEEEPEEE